MTEGIFPKSDGDVLYASEINKLPPIGTVVAWLKSYPNTPTLPNNWVECNGQTLNDAESVYNGQVIPDLNSTNCFLRGNSTSGSTGEGIITNLTPTGTTLKLKIAGNPNKQSGSFDYFALSDWGVMYNLR